MFNVRLAGGHLYGKQLFTWLSLVVSFMASFVLSFFPLDVLYGIWDLIESFSEGFLTYFCHSYMRHSILNCSKILPSTIMFQMVAELRSNEHDVEIWIRGDNLKTKISRLVILACDTPH